MARFDLTAVAWSPSGEGPELMRPRPSRVGTRSRFPGRCCDGKPSLCCLHSPNYGTTRSPIEEAGMLAPLSGRTLIQLSTGTPAEARDLSIWLASHGVNVLAGAIMPYPDGIGAADAQILFAGSADLYRSCKPTLDCLGCDLRHVSEEVGAAAVLDMALLTHQLSNYLGVWHGARACEAEGLGVDVFASMLRPDDPAAWRAATPIC